MFKVFSIYSNNEKFYTDNFFVKFGSAIVWVKADVEINEKPYFSDKKMKEILGHSNEAEKFSKMKKGDKIIVQYGSCTNKYVVVKMTEEEVKLVKEIVKKKKQLAKMQKENNKQISNFEDILNSQATSMKNAINLINSVN